ncbi:expressed unknown protein [Seminavis robusta]|uniref:Uncharacterized protein n=1 Tax=Seminavis robusta TaxID=568900 RepID=A0A9N8DM90_9STRA|nr:expressed unknown protein [Seminavis robusta]|eukprot:Sro133_g063090.1 n/a (143) ;mRNA; r:70570-71099
MTSLAPPDLTLTEQEWANADEIRDVVTSSEDFEGISLTDFEYAQHALFTDGNLEDALFRIKGLHDFREEYKITSDPSKSVEEGMSLLRAFIKQHPWLLLDVSCDASSGYCCLIFDFAKLDPSAAKQDARTIQNFHWRLLLSF